MYLQNSFEDFEFSNSFCSFSDFSSHFGETKCNHSLCLWFYDSKNYTTKIGEVILWLSQLTDGIKCFKYHLNVFFPFFIHIFYFYFLVCSMCAVLYWFRRVSCWTSELGKHLGCSWSRYRSHITPVSSHHCRSQMGSQNATASTSYPGCGHTGLLSWYFCSYRWRLVFTDKLF